MEDFTFAKKGAMLQKKTDGKGVEKITLEVPRIVELREGRAKMACGLTVKSKETNGGLTINIEAKLTRTGKFKDKTRISDLLDQHGLGVEDLQEMFDIFLKNAVIGAFNNKEEFVSRMKPLITRMAANS